MKFSKISGRVSKILRRDLEFWERVLWNFKLWKLAPLFLRGTLEGDIQDILLTVDCRLSTVKIFSPKNLAIFHIFGDFLLRSGFIS